MDPLYQLMLRGAIAALVPILGLIFVKSELGTLALLTCSYLLVSVLLLNYSSMLIARIRFAVVGSMFFLAGNLFAAAFKTFMGRQDEADPYLFLVIYGLIASLPITIIGFHNLAWSFRQLEDERLPASSVNVPPQL